VGLKGELPVVTGLRVDDKEMLLTTVVAAAPRPSRAGAERACGRSSPRCASAVLFISSIFSPWAVCSARSRRDRADRLVLAQGAEAHPEPVIT
jgi:hypothetical protein